MLTYGMRSPRPVSVWLLACASLLLVAHFRPAQGGTHDVIEDHECLRSCPWPPSPKICRYEFTLEWYHTMSTACRDCPFNVTDCYRPHCIPANGVLRSIAVVNRQMPGPAIHVCQHDTIEVKVRNHLVNSEGIAIHWHGIHQRGTPYMDGVPMVTQCPILYRSSFTYKFQADMAGTFFWHAHGIPRVEGAAGPLVVRQPPPDDVHSALYDHDLPQHALIVQDWLHELFLDRYTTVFFHHLALFPPSIVVNGRGRYREFVDPATNATATTPRFIMHVKQGHRYRIRSIGNMAMECMLELSVDDHRLTVIASDSAPIRPLEANSVALASGERYDFVLHADAPVGKYWLRVTGLNVCQNLQEKALVVYEGAEDFPEPAEDDPPGSEGGVRLNPFDMKSSDAVLNSNDMVAAEGSDQVKPADVVHYVGLNFNLVNNLNYNDLVHNPAWVTEGNATRFVGVPSSQINHVSFRPASRPLLTQSREISEFELCTFRQAEAMREHCEAEFCECTQVLEVKLGQVVELVLVDEGMFLNAHPMHSHGFLFHVLARDKLGSNTTLEEVMRMDEAGEIVRRTDDVPLKDTVAVPDGGYVVIRFEADNPGWWLFHCHVEIHFTPGMSMVIHVGSDEDLPPIPKDLPRCGGDWYPGDDKKTPPAQDAPGNAAGTHHGGALTAGLLLICHVTLLVLIPQY